jgi:hypothetical protein
MSFQFTLRFVMREAIIPKSNVSIENTGIPVRKKGRVPPPLFPNAVSHVELLRATVVNQVKAELTQPCTRYIECEHSSDA